MQSVLIRRRRQAAATCLMLLALIVPGPAVSQTLFGRQIEVTLAAQDGKPMADAEVRVFAPSDPTRPVIAGKTDSNGKFYFTANRDGFWTAEARRGDEVARVSVRVTGLEGGTEQLSPWLLFGGLLLLLALAIGFRILRARSRRPRV
ncbi:MAG TPA: hypothetical protein VHU15_06955 [Stellaceae bacterium]|jgi:hypothetical protein|nr:hypothetical protein [Stellaceae bacterium]